MNEDTSYYDPPRVIVDIFAGQGLSLTNPDAYGGWKDLKLQARTQIELLQHHYPKMNREEQLRAGRTIKQLSEQHGISI